SGAETVTVSLGGCSGCALLAANPTDVGSSSLTYTLTSSLTSVHYFYVNGVAPGTATITVTAPGFASATLPLTVYNSGFYFNGGGSANLGTFAGSQTFTVATLTETSAGAYQTSGQPVRPGAGPFTIPLTLGPNGTNVGTIDATSVSIGAGSYYAQAHFTPANAGTATVSLTQPSGFTLPTCSGCNQTISYTVTAQPINVSGALGVGANLQGSAYFYLSAAPPSGAETVTVSLGGCSGCALLAANPTDVGSSSLTYTLTSSFTSVHYVYVNGVTPGTATITVSAPGFASATIPVTVYNSGFYFNGGGSANLGTFAGPQTFTVATLTETSAGAYVTSGQPVRPGAGPFTIPLTLGPNGTNVGTIDANSVSIGTGNYYAQAHFTPQAVGTATVSLTQPSGFTLPTCSGCNQTISYSVTTPVIQGPGSVGVTAGSSSSAYVYLSETPPNPVTITLTVANGGSSTALLSATSGGTGGSTLTFAGASNSSVQYFYVQGLAQGTTTITVSAPGYADLTIPVTVN
ncbi:MAG: hypothetical protein ACRD2D_13550, partial [Terriglobales bacterium]